MVIGGVANLFWGVPRTTLDIDLTVQLEEKHCTSFVKELKPRYRFRVKNPLSFIARTNVLPLEDPKGIQIDLIFAKLPYELRAIRRSKRVKVNGQAIQVCSPEDLIIHKIVSDRLRDRDDVRGVIESSGGRLDRRYLDPIVKNLAKALAKPDLLRFYQSCFRRA